MGFQKKRGAVGWPGPQARRLEKWCERYSIDCDLQSIAATGSRYYRLTAPDEESITVRVSDHADAYCTADFSIDPAYDQWSAVREWIQEHGEKQVRARRISQKTREKIVGSILAACAEENIGAQYRYPWIYIGKDASRDSGEVCFAVFEDRTCNLHTRAELSEHAQKILWVLEKIIRRYGMRVTREVLR